MQEAIEAPAVEFSQADTERTAQQQLLDSQLALVGGGTGSALLL